MRAVNSINLIDSIIGQILHSPVISFSKRDLLQGTIVSPAWYRCRVETIGEEPAKDQSKGPSTNYPVAITVLFDGDTGNTQFADVPINYVFNSKAIGFAVGFLTALGVSVEAEKRIDLKAAEGMMLDIYIENDTYQNRLVNRVNHKYRAPRPDVSAAA